MRSPPRELKLEPGFKIVDHAQEQGIPLIANGAYTEYVSIADRGITQLLSVRCILKPGSSV